jgi:hypothetical protein
LPQEHFLFIELYLCQQYPQQYDFIVPPKLANAPFRLQLPLRRQTDANTPHNRIKQPAKCLESAALAFPAGMRPALHLKSCQKQFKAPRGRCFRWFG